MPNGRRLAWSSFAVYAMAAFAAVAGAQTINLVTGNDKAEWTRIAIPPTHPVSDIAQWHIDPATKTIVCDGNGGHEWLRFNREFRDFRLHVEWRFTKLDGSPHYNSGVLFRNDADGTIWHQAQTSPGGRIPVWRDHDRRNEDLVQPDEGDDGKPAEARGRMECL
jgi:hypothetical protein